MKKQLRILTIIALILCLICLYGCSKKNNNISSTEEIAVTTHFPVINVTSEGNSFNYLKPYNTKMASEYMYESLTPVLNNTVEFTIGDLINEVVRIEYVMYDMTGKVLENATLADKSLFSNGKFSLSLSNISKEEHMLEIKLCFSEEKLAYYYTRVVSGDSTAKSQKYATDIIDACLGMENEIDLTLCMEWDMVKTYSSYYESDIKCDKDQATWGGLDIKGSVDGYYVNITDCRDNITSFIIEYKIISKDGTTTYEVNDFMRIRERDNQMYLLNFYRNTSEVFEDKDDNFDDNLLYLGVGSGNEKYQSLDEGKKLFFIKNQKLFYFDYDSNRIINIYSAGESDKQKLMLNEHNTGVYPLGEYEDAYYYALGGYIYDSVHNGFSGICIMKYDYNKGVTEEVFSQTMLYEPDLVLKELDKLHYLNEKGECFIILNGQVCSYNISTGEIKEEVKNINLDSFVFTDTNGCVAFNKKQDNGEDKLSVKNLNTGQEMSINPKSQEAITPIGFVGEDLVYGVSSTDENENGYLSDNQTLMNKIIIVDSKGKTVKEYPAKNEQRIISGFTSDSFIALNIADKTQEGTIFTAVTQQQIVSGNTKKKNYIEKKEHKSVGKGNVWAFSLNNKFKGTPALSVARLTLKQTDEKETSLVKADASNRCDYYKDKYFVHAKGYLYGVYQVMREALNYAADMAGVVTDSANNTMFYRMAKDKEAAVSVQNPQLAADILDKEMGVVVKWQELKADAVVLDITGFKLEDALIFIDIGYPVLARYDSQSFVWIIAYNDSSILCQKTDSEVTFSISLEKANEIFTKTGFEWYTCNN